MKLIPSLLDGIKGILLYPVVSACFLVVIAHVYPSGVARDTFLVVGGGTFAYMVNEADKP